MKSKYGGSIRNRFEVHVTKYRPAYGVADFDAGSSKSVFSARMALSKKRLKGGDAYRIIDRTSGVTVERGTIAKRGAKAKPVRQPEWKRDFVGSDGRTYYMPK